jgi:hypothetical protein
VFEFSQIRGLVQHSCLVREVLVNRLSSKLGIDFTPALLTSRNRQNTNRDMGRDAQGWVLSRFAVILVSRYL